MRWSKNALLNTFLAFSCAFGASAACSAGAGDSPGDGDAAGDGDEGGDGDISLGGDGDLADLPQIEGSITSDAGDAVAATGAPVSVQFTLLDKSGKPIEGADWTTDDVRIGSISSDGVFTANGFVGGVVKITAHKGGAVLSTELTVDVDILENPGSLDEGAQETLLSGGSSDPTFQGLYPYSGTVFPRGVGSPLLQFAGAAATSTYLEITAPHFVYRQFAGPSSRIQLTIPDAVWRGLSLTVQPGVEAFVRVVKADGSGVTGPADATWYFASASLKGIIYYSTYNYKQEGPVEEKAAIMAVPAGGEASVVQTGCTACHTVSADGSTLAAGLGNGPDSTQGELYNPIYSDSYDIVEGATLSQRTRSDNGRTFSFIGLSPDGSVGVTNGLPANLWPPHIMHGVAVSVAESATSQLVRTSDGSVVNSNLDTLVTYAQTPAFAPDGSRLVFGNGDYLGANSNHRVLSVLDVDLTANPPVFSNLRDIVENTSNVALAWPTFLPDGNGVVYQEGDSFDSHDFVAVGAPYDPSFAELRMVDIETGTQNQLNALNGRNPDGTTFYLPFGGTEEGEMNYEASVLPVAVGGYYWVIFTSRRAYGNEIGPDGRIAEVDNEPWGTESVQSARKKIWMAAIDVNYKDSPDPSHPAFYLDGQTLHSGNMRGFAALAPCRPNGESCESGSDCCDGFCRETSRSSDGTPVLECVPPPDTCSNVDELCETPADCCDTSLLCVNNRCTQPTPTVVK